MRNIYIVLFIMPMILCGQLEYIKEYYDSGVLKREGNYDNKNKEKVGFWKFYHDNGILKSEGNYKYDKRKGFWKFYYNTGQVKIRASYRYGKLRGYYCSYYKNGQLEREGNFIDIEELAGFWNFYDENGELKEEHRYKDGVLVSRKIFDQNNNEITPSVKQVSKYFPLSRPVFW